ncbi:hypothetical protein PRIPAC_74749 [Pristionchus pacificus]|uniref:Uncharacterized protein n=1 Tax=Pristionchus pacificus TaxID=54126 RepID=A0A2A6C0C8_PRIPA|nr:hypothetical protein PRIPAC_74749 [Pristionchus pacificus]|eukprot:PDM71634.1 hypothetical protein PRIPAC_38041 [Pristionchus pacificus]
MSARPLSARIHKPSFKQKIMGESMNSSSTPSNGAPPATRHRGSNHHHRGSMIDVIRIIFTCFVLFGRDSQQGNLFSRAKWAPD